MSKPHASNRIGFHSSQRAFRNRGVYLTALHESPRTHSVNNTLLLLLLFNFVLELELEAQLYDSMYIQNGGRVGRAKKAAGRLLRRPAGHRHRSSAREWSGLGVYTYGRASVTSIHLPSKSHPTASLASYPNGPTLTSPVFSSIRVNRTKWNSRRPMIPGTKIIRRE